MLGKDPQRAPWPTTSRPPRTPAACNLNSGIPNHAFFLAATTIGGYAWEGRGAVWWDALTSPETTEDIDFAGFARVTVDAAAARFGQGSTEHAAVEDAWRSVGVLTGP